MSKQEKPTAPRIKKTAEQRAAKRSTNAVSQKLEERLKLDMFEAKVERFEANKKTIWAALFSKAMQLHLLRLKLQQEDSDLTHTCWWFREFAVDPTLGNERIMCQHHACFSGDVCLETFRLNDVELIEELLQDGFNICRVENDRREAQQREVKRLSELRASGLAKLSPDELIALGLGPLTDERVSAFEAWLS